MQSCNDSVYTKDFNLLWGTNFLMALAFYFLLPTMPAYAKFLGADTKEIGYVIGIYTFSALAIRPFTGYALDSFGRKKVYLWALGFFTLLIGTYYFAPTFAYLLLIRFFHGFSWGAITVSGGTIVADLLPERRRGEGVGIFGLSMTIAMALGPSIGLLLLGDNQYGRVFTGSLILTAFAFLIANLINYPRLPVKKSPFSWNAFFEKRVIPISVVMFFTTLVYGGLVTFITLYADKELRLTEVQTGLFFLVYAVALSLVRPISGKLLDKRGPSPVAAGGFILLIAGFLLLSVRDGLTMFLASAVLIGTGNGLLWPTVQTMVINMVEPFRRGVANSTFFSALDLGIAAGSIVLGWLANLTSFSTMYFVSGLLVILPMMYFFLHVVKDYNAKKIQGECS